MWRTVLAASLATVAVAAIAVGQQSNGYLQESQTPGELAKGGPGFVQIDAAGHPFIGAVAPGSGTVINSGNLTSNSVLVGTGGSGVAALGGTVGGPLTTGGALTTTGATSGVTLGFGSGSPSYQFPAGSSTLASLDGSETFTNKTLTNPTVNNETVTGNINGNPVFTGTPSFNNIGPGTQVSCLGLDSTNKVVILPAACGTGGTSVGSQFNLAAETGQTVGSIFSLTPES